MNAVSGGLIGACIPLVVAWFTRRVIGPWIAAPVASHVRAELTDLVAVIVLSPEIQADIQETVTREVGVLAKQMQALDGRAGRLDERTARLEAGQNRLEQAVADLTRMTRQANE